MTNHGSWISVRRARLRPVAILLSAVMLAEACTSWTVAREPVPTLVARKADTQIRASLQNGAVVEISSVVIERDSLLGFRANSPDRVAIALDAGIVPATLGTDHIDPALPPCHIALRAEPSSSRNALVLAEGFGGKCAALALECA